MEEKSYRGGAAKGAPSSADEEADRRLGRRRRLSRPADFRLVFERGRRRAGRYLVLVRRAGEADESRAAFVAGKRTFRRAVDRARARRLLREAYRLQRGGMTGRWDMILIARRPILDVKRQAVEEELVRLAAGRGRTREKR
ncbi:MAG: ribonuclease P protein component [Lentisphaerae bacterium]|nr:ribonuclease P protein component [Lentisphaerota bacterium]